MKDTRARGGFCTSPFDLHQGGRGTAAVRTVGLEGGIGLGLAVGLEPELALGLVIM